MLGLYTKAARNPSKVAGLVDEPPLPDYVVADLKSKIKGHMASPENVALLSHLSIGEREYFAYKAGEMVLYIGDEVGRVRAAEEQSALRAAPKGYELHQLIGLNIGCGDRTISPHLLPVDILRSNIVGVEKGEHAALNPYAFLALSDNLPFKENSVDFIVSLHMLEHIEDPIGTINHWLDVIKPGGGIGIVVPDWRYTWDSRKDNQPFSHKWNPTPWLIERIYRVHWESRAYLEQLNSYDMALSFDFVLRKKGAFKPFSAPAESTMRSGAELERLGIFLSEDTFKISFLQRATRAVLRRMSM